jgi:DNA repair exonuclease SbcCD ATPase subunit
MLFNPRSILPGTACLALCVALFAGNLAHAAKDDNKRMARAQMERIAKLQQAQQALEAEKGQIAAEKSALEGQLKSAQADLGRARAASRREAVLKRDVELVRAEKTQLQDKMTATQAEHDKTVTELKAQIQAAQEDAAQWRRKSQAADQALAQRVKALSTCEANNQGLYKLNTSLLEQYEKRTCSSEWFKGGPFTQLDRVKVENDRDTYQDKFDTLRVKPLPAP